MESYETYLNCNPEELKIALNEAMAGVTENSSVEDIEEIMVIVNFMRMPDVREFFLELKDNEEEIYYTFAKFSHDNRFIVFPEHGNEVRKLFVKLAAISSYLENTNG